MRINAPWCSFYKVDMLGETATEVQRTRLHNLITLGISISRDLSMSRSFYPSNSPNFTGSEVNNCFNITRWNVEFYVSNLGINIQSIRAAHRQTDREQAIRTFERKNLRRANPHNLNSNFCNGLQSPERL